MVNEMVEMFQSEASSKIGIRDTLKQIIGTGLKIRCLDVREPRRDLEVRKFYIMRFIL